MDFVLPDYSVSNATWFYLSLLLIIAVYFRFNRLWSLRNLDLALLLSISPGLLLVAEGRDALGYGWLFGTTGLLLVRMFCDGLFKRRPLLEQNLNVPGLVFLCVAAFFFLMTKVMTEPPSSATVETVGRADNLLSRTDAAVQRPADEASADEAAPGPASRLLAAPATLTARVVATGTGAPNTETAGVQQMAARFLAVVAHMAVIGGLIALAYRHFGDLKIGLAMATLYLLLPCTAFDVQKVNHVLPAALIVWALVAYRRPMVAGCLMGLACGALFFPVFLLPLWLTFYGRRGALRFGLALVIVAAVLLGSLVLTSANTHSLTTQIIGSIDWSVLKFRSGGAAGFWSTHDAAYRIPVIAAFAVMAAVLTFLPWNKNLEHLISHSTAIVVGTQFWYPQQGGVYLLWYLPLLLLVVFRPRLAHLVPPATGATQAESQPQPEPAVTERAVSLVGGSRQFR